MDHGWQLGNSPLHLDCCTQGLILFARSDMKLRQSYAAHQSYTRSSVPKVNGQRDVTFNL